MAANATAIWRVRPSGSNTNGGGFDVGIASYGTDYSQRNTPILSNIGTVTTATTTLTDTGASFTSALIGNAIYVSGTSITTSYTFITAVPTSTTLTLQTSPGTAGTAVTYNIGGGWADFWTNTTAAAAWLKPGNICYILGSGTPNPSSYSYDYTYGGTGFAPVVGSTATGAVAFANDPATPGYLSPPNTTGGMPCISVTNSQLVSSAGSQISWSGLYFVSGSAASAGNILFTYTGAVAAPALLFGCVFDQNTADVSFLSTGSASIIGCEIFSSTAPGAAGTHAAIHNVASDYVTVVGCNIHDCVGAGISAAGASASIIQNNIIAKCQIDGIQVTAVTVQAIIIGNTIDGNLGNGILISTTVGTAISTIMNNILSNHTQASKSGLNISAGTATTNNRVKVFADYNVYYNNTTDTTNISYGAHDTYGGSNPYVGQSTENYTLA